jgi:hypothetical protein
LLWLAGAWLEMRRTSRRLAESNEIMNSEFKSLIGLVVFLLAVSQAIFWRLRSRHGEKFRAMGAPHLFLNNTPHTSWNFCVYLFKQEHRSLNDPLLSILSDGLVILNLVYLAGLLVQNLR